jgi:hypothetical protein
LTTTGTGRKPHPRRAATGHDIEVLEKNTDTSWALFQALQQQQELGFQKTRPAMLPEAAATADKPLTVDDVLLEARRQNRVCPTPVVWQRLYDFLPNKTPQLAQVPGTRAEWDQLPPLQKRSRLREHIEWAAVQGVLKEVHEALKALPESRWHHMGE